MLKFRDVLESYDEWLRGVVGCKIPRKENSPIFRFVLCTPPVPVFPGSPELTRRLIKTNAPDKKIGLFT